MNIVVVLIIVLVAVVIVIVYMVEMFKLEYCFSMLINKIVLILLR